MSDKATDCYVAYCPKCGALCAAIVDDPRIIREVAKETGKWIRQGLRVERADLETVRGKFQCCRCTSKKRKGSPVDPDAQPRLLDDRP